MLKYCFAFALLILQFNAVAQDEVVRSKNAVYGELFGQSYVLSVNYERLLWQKPSMYLSGRIGVGLISGAAGAFLNIGKRYDYLETGLNTGVADHGSIFKHEYDVFVSPSLGYKRLAPRGFFIKVYACPMFFPKCYLEQNTYTAPGIFVSGLACNRFLPMFGLGLGYNWKRPAHHNKER